ncbi:MAG: membrane protein insertase YidC [Enterobacteriaceae bacterium PSmelAO3-2]|nr:membrane protein insertase YidC [Enterobacteriaceae bacterium Cmel17]WMC17476.1 MAG: membrane protein insertase YidC [Enterobacteriaceae bacterium Cmel21]WMC17683.1 MAG: membrane protein insertase YidC [Enterobacteriaceae bacterium PSmelAO3-2]WMC17887.1 MAG: membrane protein insertase YidC [Enterobacteriaceae bacterium PSmelAO3-1]WMC18090.1 MAG: membrane protein insertase YidC [Enterobacteriaceae bacterium PSmelAO1]
MNIKRKFFLIILFLSFLFTFILFKSNKNSKHYFNKNQNINNKSNTINLNYNEIIKNKTKKYKKIKIKTDLLYLIINTNGGIIEEAKLLKYKNNLSSLKPIELLKTTNSFIYQINNNLIKKEYLFNNTNKIILPKFRVEKNYYSINNNKNYISIPMYYKDDNNNIFIKTLILKNKSYVIKIINTFINNNITPIKLSSFGQIKQTINLPINNKKNNDINKNFRGIAYSSNIEKYKKISFKDNINLNITTKSGWIAMLQKYFTTAIIPISKTNNIFYSEKTNNNICTIGFQSNPIIIKPFQSHNFKISLWIGPKLQSDMEKLSPYLSSTIDYGFLWFISKPLFKILKFIHFFFGNWGFSIILITLFLRFIMYPISKFQYIYLKKIILLQPKIKKIKEINKHNKEKLNEEILKLYKIEKVNPLLGLIPILIQTPIFLSLYNILIESIELRHSKFIFWIHDLSAKDPYYILPILLSITIYYIQKISPININNTPNIKIINFIPIIYSIFFFWFPSGLIIYYIVNNIFIIFQQKKIYKI